MSVEKTFRKDYGSLGDTPLNGAVIGDLSPLPELHPAQVSAVYPGYPKPRQGESDAAFRYRLNRDAAHVDGLLAIGPERRRMLRERHAYILGLPLTECSETAAPMTIIRLIPARSDTCPVMKFPMA